MKGLENIEQTFKSVKRRIKAVLYRYEWKQVLIFLFFVLLSFGFWVLQSLQEEYEIRVTVPVRYRNMPNDVAFVNTPPYEITARLRDKGSVLLNYSLGQKLSYIDIDMKDIAGKSGVFLLPQKDIESKIMKQLIATTNLVSFMPSQIEVPYSLLVNKKLPVVFNGDIRTEPGHALSGEIIINPPTVDVYATQALLDSLESVKTVYAEIKKGTKTVDRKFQLEKIEGATFEPNSVTLSIPIEEFTEKSLEIPVISKNVPNNFTIRMFPSKVKVSCNVPLSRYKELSEEQFSVEITVDLDKSISGTLPVTLIKKPDWVDKVTISPEVIEFILEPKNVE